MRNLLTVIAMMVMAFATQAQRSPEIPEITNPIMNMFKGMNLGDSSMVRKSFYKDVTLVTLRSDSAGNPKFTYGNLDGFLKAVASPHEQSWNEPIWDVKIEVNGLLANVWANYAFFYGKKFTHCGIDNFQLVKTAEGWKIFYLADTRQTEGCNVPPQIKNQFK